MGEMGVLLGWRWWPTIKHWFDHCEKHGLAATASPAVNSHSTTDLPLSSDDDAEGRQQGLPAGLPIEPSSDSASEGSPSIGTGLDLADDGIQPPPPKTAPPLPDLPLPLPPPPPPPPPLPSRKQDPETTQEFPLQGPAFTFPGPRPPGLGISFPGQGPRRNVPTHALTLSGSVGHSNLGTPTSRLRSVRSGRVEKPTYKQKSSAKRYKPILQAPDTVDPLLHAGNYLPPAGHSGGTLHIYTDASFHSLEHFSGVGITFKHNDVYYDRAIALGRLPDSETAEMEGIRYGLSWARMIVPHIGATSVVLHTDNKYCAHVMSGTQTLRSGSRLYPFYQATSRLASELHVNVEFRWVSAHVNIPGNERADRLAKHGRDKAQHKGYTGKVFNKPISARLKDLMARIACNNAKDGRDSTDDGASHQIINSGYRKASRRRRRRGGPGRF